MRVLVACEESQVVTKAFRERGHEAYSCDLQPCSGGRPEWHIQGNALDYLEEGWDLLIAHPPCTYMSNAGACRMYVRPGVVNAERLEKAMKAKELFEAFAAACVPRICIENPVPMKIVGLPPCDQVIQPWMFGDEFSKKTCLWLKNLPILMATAITWDYIPFCPSNTSKASRGGGADPKAVRSAETMPKRGAKPSPVLRRQWQTNGVAYERTGPERRNIAERERKERLNHP